MTRAQAGRRRFQFSVQSLLGATTLAALALAPVAWVTRERRGMVRTQEEILGARNDAIRAVVLGERGRAEVERLRRENAELREAVERLRREVDRLKAARSAGAEEMKDADSQGGVGGTGEDG